MALFSHLLSYVFKDHKSFSAVGIIMIRPQNKVMIFLSLMIRLLGVSMVLGSRM